MAGAPPIVGADIRQQVSELYLGLSNGSGDDHRSVESADALSVRDVLLRAEVMRELQGRAATSSAGAKGHALGGAGLAG